MERDICPIAAFSQNKNRKVGAYAAANSQTFVLQFIDYGSHQDLNNYALGQLNNIHHN